MKNIIINGWENLVILEFFVIYYYFLVFEFV